MWTTVVGKCSVVSSLFLAHAIAYSCASARTQTVLPDGPGRPTTNVTDDLTRGLGTRSMPCHGVTRMPATRGPICLCARNAALQNSAEPINGPCRASHSCAPQSAVWLRMPAWI